MRRFASYDLETYVVQPGLLAPPIVCGSAATAEVEQIKLSEDELARQAHTNEPVVNYLVRAPGGELLTKEQALAAARAILSDEQVTLIGANIPYDFACLAAEDPSLLKLIFKAYAEGRVVDIQTAQALHAIAEGNLYMDPNTGRSLRNKKGKQERYNVGVVVRLVRGREDAKENDFWRKRYAILESIPQEKWPWDAQQYPKDDANNELEVGLAQLGLLPETVEHNNLSDLAAQCETHFAMYLGAVWGIRTSRERVEALEARVEAWYAKFVERYKKVGFIRENGKENSAAVKRAVAKAYGADTQCEACKGTGRRRHVKREPCRGVKLKNKYQGCPIVSGGVSCAACSGSGFTEKLGNEVNCEDCDGSGYDLTSAPALPLTDTGGISTSRDTLAESGESDLHDYAENEPEKIRNTYIPALKQGVDKPFNLRPNVLVESGRTSYDGIIQLIPRMCPACMFKLKDQACTCVRPCFEAREGYWYCSVDYSALELVTLSQVCLWVCGFSKMAETINESRDPGFLHTALAARMIGVDAVELKARIKGGDKQAKNFRQAAKPGSFGLPGGMGAVTLVLTNRKKSAGITDGPDGRKYDGIRFCILIDNAKECGVEKITEWKGRVCPPVCRQCVELIEYQLKPAWHEQWPEMREYFGWVTRTLDQYNGMLPCFGPWAAEGLDDWERRAHRVRGGLSYTSGCNNAFQSLAADGAKSALRRVVREAYLDPDSPLWGTRPVMFVHDEIFSEMPSERAHVAGPHKAKVMIEEMKRWTPDVLVAAEPALMTNWYKDAEPTYDATGKLIPWEPKEKGK
jgi:hypothetical protein